MQYVIFCDAHANPYLEAPMGATIYKCVHIYIFIHSWPPCTSRHLLMRRPCKWYVWIYVYKLCIYVCFYSHASLTWTSSSGAFSPGGVADELLKVNLLTRRLCSNPTHFQALFAWQCINAATTKHIGCTATFADDCWQHCDINLLVAMHVVHPYIYIHIPYPYRCCNMQ